MIRFLSILAIFFLTTISAFSADMRFIQIDGLLYDNNSSVDFQNIINKINKEKDVDFVIFTGDNIAKPNTKLLDKFLNDAKKIKAPYYIVLGQKDINKQKKLSKFDYTETLRKNVKTHRKIESPNYVFIKNKVVFIVLDGSKEVIPMTMGYYRANVLDWLETQLNLYQKNNVVILQHYPIVPPSKKESHYTYKADEYLKVLSKYSNVKAVVAGHFNVNNEQTVNGILHIATKNAPNYRIIDILDYDTKNPTFWSTIKE